MMACFQGYFVALSQTRDCKCSPAFIFGEFWFVTLSAFQALSDLAPKYILEQFLESELVVNITEHSVSSLVSFVLLQSLHFFSPHCYSVHTA